MLPMRHMATLVVLGLVAACPAFARPLPKDAATDVKITLSPVIEKLLGDAATTPAQRRAIRLFHGQWDDLADLTLDEQARIAMWRFDLRHPSLTDEGANPLIRARAAAALGEPEAVLSILDGQISAATTIERARAMVDLGRRTDALILLRDLKERMRSEPPEDAAELTAGAEALAMLARLQGQDAQDYHLAMRMLGKAHGELDRLYWPAHLVEARLLMEKGNEPQALKATIDAMRLNLRSSEGWYLLGLLELARLRFHRVEHCVTKLRQINEQHLLAQLLETKSALVQNDVASARQALAPALEHLPKHRQVLAMNVAVAAMSFSEPDVTKALARFEAVLPDNPLAYATAGNFLASARQYPDADTMLRKAIELAPNWCEPHVARGLMLMQWGKEEAAQAALKEAVRLDPFNVRAANQLELVEELLGYEQLETEHFVIKWRRGIDDALAHDMPEALEQIYREITGIFEYEPPRRTLIEIMPDERYLGVRITGIPEIWTIAACSGDVIALTPPRLGARQRGPFDWPRVVRHEFTHTVTLNQTAYRIPHWYTEACAVSTEPGDRDYPTCKLLAAASTGDTLFDLRNINWAFVRPKKPHDRQLAYGQAEWMLEYLTEAFGHAAVLQMLREFRKGATTEQAIAAVTGASADQFMPGFKAWTSTQVSQWGLQKSTLTEPIPPAHNPSILRVAADHALKADDAEAARIAVLRYAAARPVDPWSHQALAKLAMATGRTDEAIASLEHLDRQEQKTGKWAHQLAVVYRRSGRLDLAAATVQRALSREPYNGTYRELAGAIALQRGDNDAALHHIEALVVLEPTRSIHHVRLAAMYDRIGDAAKARKAAEQARTLDPESPVARFLDR